MLVVLSSFYYTCQTKHPYNEGKELYTAHCANCHGDDGSGLGELIPPLAKADMLKQLDIQVACLMRKGIAGKMVVNGIEYDNVMPANAQLSDVEIQNIANYIHNSWGNTREFISLDAVRHVLNDCPQ